MSVNLILRVCRSCRSCRCRYVRARGQTRNAIGTQNWQDNKTAGGDPNLQHAKGIGINRKTVGWNAAAAVFAYGYGTLSERSYKYVGQDQLIGGTWPDNEPAVSCMDWHTGEVNAK